MSDISLTQVFKLPPEQALRYFEAKGLQLTGSWGQLTAEAHVRTFTIANLARQDILADIRQALIAALREGITLQQFVQQLQPMLQEKGWWGPAIDPVTGEILATYPGTSKPVQQGSMQRLSLIYQQNLMTAYNVGRYHAMQAARDIAPYWQYVAVMDAKTRPHHAALNGQVFRHDDPLLDTHWPPNGWNCRCRMVPKTQRQMDREGLSVENSTGRLVKKTVQAGTDEAGNPKYTEVTGINTGALDKDGNWITFYPDAGWSHNPGKTWTNTLQQLTAER